MHELQRRFSTWAWPKPVTLQGGDGSDPECSDPMPIMCPTEEANAARNVPVSTKDAMLEELRRAAAGEAAVPPFASFEHLIRVEVRAEQPELQRAAAWVEARLLVLVRSLDACSVRPMKLGAGFWVLGASASSDVLERAARQFQERLASDPGESFCDLIEVAAESREEIKQRVQERGASPKPSPKLAPKAAPR